MPSYLRSGLSIMTSIFSIFSSCMTSCIKFLTGIERKGDCAFFHPNQKHRVGNFQDFLSPRAFKTQNSTITVHSSTGVSRTFLGSSSGHRLTWGQDGCENQINHYIPGHQPSSIHEMGRAKLKRPCRLLEGIPTTHELPA